MAKKFTPIQHYKEDKDGNQVKVDLFKGTTFEEMFNWIKENGTKEEKEKFLYELKHKHVYVDALDENGNVKKNAKGKAIKVKTEEIIETKPNENNVLGARVWFFNTFAPEYAPKKKENNKTSINDLLKDLF